jgi:CHAT domain-containing protein
LDLALSAVANGHTAPLDDVLDHVIRSRGVVLDELGARVHLTAQSDDPVLATLNSAVMTARERFANLMMRSLKGDNPVPRAILDEARGAKEEAERALAERSASARAELAQANVGLKLVREKLPADTALVAFVRYDRTTVTDGGVITAPRTTPSYMAFVIRSGIERIDAVPLGSATNIENAVATWRAQVEGRLVAAETSIAAERAYRTAGLAVRRRIWDPISSLVHETTQVFLVPDGALNLVSFAALPTGTNRYLIEDGPLVHYLASERDIAAGSSPDRGRGLLAVGGPAYGERAQSGGGSPNLVRDGCGALGGLHFEDLPGSRVEAAEVAKIWSSTSDEPNSARILNGRAATKRAVERDAIGRRVIHLATHGFFLQSPCDSKFGGTRGVGGLAAGANQLPEFAENPLLFSGLAFAGANAYSARTDRRDDGILTAEEVAGLNLQGTEWAVLSACDTGTGMIKAGEGVFGLRRAFQVAGVGTIIMSLWSVEDYSTQIWMRYLYEARFKSHLTTAAAVRDADLKVLKQRRSRHESTHPFFWAGFVAAGDWR